MASEEPTTTTPTTDAGAGLASPSPSTWAKAREASQQRILQAAMEDLESKAARLENELHDFKIQSEQKEERLQEKQKQVASLEASMDDQASKLKETESKLREAEKKYMELEEGSKTNRERADRLVIENDSLRGEIR